MSGKVTILGCGSSAGVPMIGCRCDVCASTNPKNNRTRVSILIETQGKKLLVDVSPDLRQQALRHGITSVDAIILTHAHADHCHGIDDVRSLNFHKKEPIEIYSSSETLEEVRRRFDYAFKPPIPEYGWFRPALVPHIVDIAAKEPFVVAGDVPVQPFVQWHGKSRTMGLRVGNMAYSTDVNHLPEDAFEHLYGLDLWIVDCLRYEPAPTHAHLALTLEWIARAKPKRAVLTHLGHEFDYEALRKELPECVEPAFDGLEINL